MGYIAEYYCISIVETYRTLQILTPPSMKRAGFANSDMYMYKDLKASVYLFVVMDGL